jgi:hypothetical protein
MVKVWPRAPAPSRNVTGHTGLGEMYLRRGHFLPRVDMR